MRELNGRFKKGHPKVGGFVKGSKHTPESKAKIVIAMHENRNRWLGDKAGYHAVHMWLTKHYSKGETCENCGKVTPYLDWANISGQYRRTRHDYKVLCRSCHRLMDTDNKCRNGHEYKPETTHINTRGHRWCLICKEQKYATTS